MLLDKVTTAGLETKEVDTSRCRVTVEIADSGPIDISFLKVDGYTICVDFEATHEGDEDKVLSVYQMVKAMLNE